jgi:hypothetical protein
MLRNVRHACFPGEGVIGRTISGLTEKLDFETNAP